MIFKKLSFKRKKSGGRSDHIFLIAVLALVLMGTVAVYTAGSHFASVRYGDKLYFIKRQILWVTIGIVAMYIGSEIKLPLLKLSAKPLYLATVILLILTLIIGFTGNGAKRWISLGPITIQPSEIAKLAIPLILAYYFDKHQAKATESRSGRESLVYGTLLPSVIMIIPIVLVMLQKHLSCIIILGVIGVLVIVLSGARLRYMAGVCGAGLAGVSYIALFTDYTKERITVWRNPEAFKLTGGWQTLQGLMAIGSGGLFGKGFGNGELKQCYVSEPANDMIFAIICEELGFIGAGIVMLSFVILITRGFYIANRSGGYFERLLALGIMTQVSVQTILNVAVVTNTIPNTGISLPFFSYGGSSLIMLMFEMGIIISISRHANINK